MEHVDFIEEPCDVEIKHGTVRLTWPSGLKIAVPLAVFRLQHERVKRTLAEFDAKRAVVPIRKKRGGHAATGKSSK